MAVVGPASQSRAQGRDGRGVRNEGVGCGESAGWNGILGAMEGEVMVPWAVMDVEESYTALDVPQSCDGPVCPQDHPRWLCEK